MGKKKPSKKISKAIDLYMLTRNGYTEYLGVDYDALGKSLDDHLKELEARVLNASIVNPINLTLDDIALPMVWKKLPKSGFADIEAFDLSLLEAARYGIFMGATFGFDHDMIIDFAYLHGISKALMLEFNAASEAELEDIESNMGLWHIRTYPTGHSEFKRKLKLKDIPESEGADVFINSIVDVGAGLDSGMQEWLRMGFNMARSVPDMDDEMVEAFMQGMPKDD